MKNVLGRSLIGKKIVSQTGLQLGKVYDIDFDLSGTINLIILRPGEGADLSKYTNENNLVDIAYENVKAIGEYVIVDFPK